MVYISLRLINAKSKIKLLTSQFWSIIGGRLGVSFLIHIYVKDYHWRQKYHHMLKVVCLFWSVIFFSCCQYCWHVLPFIDCINGNLTPLHFLPSIYSLSTFWSMVPKNVLVLGESQYIFFSGLICCVFFFCCVSISILYFCLFCWLSPFVVYSCFFGYFLTSSYCRNLWGRLFCKISHQMLMDNQVLHKAGRIYVVFSYHQFFLPTFIVAGFIL